MINQPIFILGAHKSGTSLLRSLFDGHEDVFVLPIETHFFQIMNYWITYAFLRRTTPKQLSRHDFIRNAKGLINYSNNEDNPQGDGISKGIFNLERFEQYLEANLPTMGESPEQQAIYFEIYMMAVYYSIYGLELPPNKRILKKSVETAEFALDLKAMFPDAKFIHIVRNPYSNLVSMRKFRMHNKKTRFFPWLGHDFRSLHNSSYFLYRNRRLIKDYHIIRYEDLVQDPDSVITNLCQATNLEFSGKMLSPTYLGKPWSGNSTSSQVFQGISAGRLEKWKNDVSVLEINLVNKYLGHMLEEFNYERIDSSRSILFPMKQELPKEYIGNRMLLAMG